MVAILPEWHGKLRKVDFSNKNSEIGKLRYPLGAYRSYERKTRPAKFAFPPCTAGAGSTSCYSGAAKQSTQAVAAFSGVPGVNGLETNTKATTGKNRQWQK